MTPLIDQDEIKQPQQVEVKPSRASAREALKTADAAKDFKDKFNQWIDNKRTTTVENPLVTAENMTTNKTPNH